jgi:hypothetical protein
MVGYLLGILFSFLSALLAASLLRAYIVGEGVVSAMNLGGSGRGLSLKIPLLVFGGYLTIGAILALLLYAVFDSNPAIALLLNIAAAANLNISILLNEFRRHLHP